MYAYTSWMQSVKHRSGYCRVRLIIIVDIHVGLSDSNSNSSSNSNRTNYDRTSEEVPSLPTLTPNIRLFIRYPHPIPLLTYPRTHPFSRQLSCHLSIELMSPSRSCLHTFMPFPQVLIIVPFRCSPHLISSHLVTSLSVCPSSNLVIRQSHLISSYSFRACRIHVGSSLTGSFHHQVHLPTSAYVRARTLNHRDLGGDIRIDCNPM